MTPSQRPGYGDQVTINARSLVIRNLTRSAAGSYSCAAVNPEGSGASRPVQLSVKCESRAAARRRETTRECETTRDYARRYETTRDDARQGQTKRDSAKRRESIRDAGGKCLHLLTHRSANKCEMEGTKHLWERTRIGVMQLQREDVVTTLEMCLWDKH